jgi:cupin fold WbuC family metalloprotein
MRLRKLNDEVYVADEPIVRIGPGEIAFVKEQASKNERRRARICAHASNDNPLHEMIIAIARDSYIHPHRHIGKSESFHIVEGEVDVAVFDESGTVVDVIELGAVGSGRNVYYRLSTSAFHTLLIRTELLVLHEVTNGPFDRAMTVLAPFAPSENQVDQARDYMKRVSDAVARHLQVSTS